MSAATDSGISPPVDSEPSIPRSEVDFDRPVVSILGLPFDAIGIEEAVQRIRSAAFARRRCFVSTPNLNFAIAARSDREFLGSVLRSDLCLVDGMPLVWIARLLGLPVHERVSGSDVFEALHRHAGPPLTVYLFGGPRDAAARAADVINGRGGGLRCVGFDAAGFGSIESMSSAEQIGRINHSGAHFLVVSLGAKKGQAWIEHNVGRLAPPVLSHLGAVVNFAAGTVRRAPYWLQWLGLEWLWRIREEPVLWRRYGRDGVHAAILVATRVVPDAIGSRGRWRLDGAPPALESVRTSDGFTLSLSGAWGDGSEAPLRAALQDCARQDLRLTVDLQRSTLLGHRVVGLLLLARGWFGSRGGCQIVGAQGAARRALRLQLVERALLQQEPA